MTPQLSPTSLHQPPNASQEFAHIQALLKADKRDKHVQLSEITAHLTEDKLAQNSFRTHGGVPAIIHVMLVDPPNKSVQISAAALLSILAEDNNIAMEVGQNDGVKALVDSLILHSNDLAVCASAVAALRSLTYIPENRAIMLQFDLLQLLIATLNRFICDETIAESVPPTVANIIFGSDESRMKSGHLGAMQCFTKVMLTHSSSATVVAQSAFAIRNLLWQCPQNLKLAEANQTTVKLHNLLSKHQASFEVVTQVLGAFANIVSLDSNIRNLLPNEKDFFTILFHLMSSFASESNLCATICFIFITLSESDLQFDRVYARVFANLCKDTNSYSIIVGGLDNAIRNKNSDAVEKFCSLIHALSSFEDFRMDIGRTKLLEVVMNTLQNQTFYDDERATSKLLCGGIISIISGNDQAKLKFKELNGFSVILEVMKENSTSYGVVLKCTQILDNAADGQTETTEQLLDKKDEAVGPLLAAMADFAESPALQENVCSMLIKIASISSGEATKLVKAGTRPSVELAKSKHKGDPGVESLANQLLSLLVDNTSGREGRGNARGSASSRLRSRSRTIQPGSRSRSRAENSKSPDRMMKQARRALEAAKLKKEGLQGDAKDVQRASNGPVISHNRSTRGKFSLEPVYE